VSDPTTKKNVTEAEALEILKEGLPVDRLDDILPFVTPMQPFFVQDNKWRAMKENGRPTRSELDAVFQAKAKRFVGALLEQNREQAKACGEEHKALTEAHEANVKALKDEWGNEVHGLALEIEALKATVADLQGKLDMIRATASSSPDVYTVVTDTVPMWPGTAEPAVPQA
jgi:hypothetical protein